MTAPPLIWRLQHLPTLPSTSDVCRDRAEAGEAEGLAILADRQTGGRGTHGRHWQSPEGNLYLSVLLRPGGPASLAGRWALLAAVAIAEAVGPLLPGRNLSFKWPNDILLDGAKLAGVLTEAAHDVAGDLAWLVIGVGVNLHVAPDVPDRQVACVGPQAPEPASFAGDVLHRLAGWRDRLHDEGWPVVRAAWLRHGPPLGSPVTLRCAGVSWCGGFAGLADDGALRLSIDGSVRSFVAGEA